MSDYAPSIAEALEAHDEAVAAAVRYAREVARLRAAIEKLRDDCLVAEKRLLGTEYVESGQRVLYAALARRLTEILSDGGEQSQSTPEVTSRASEEGES